MRLDQATAVLRPRSAWEAIDLGCALARRDWGKLMRGFLAVALPLWLLMFVALWDYPYVVGVLLWWTKPLLTRQPVHFMSRSLFGTVPGWRDFWSDRRAALWRGLLSGLTVRRFSVQRSFRLPVIMLEGLRGKAYNERCAVLGTHGGGSAFWLTYTAFKLEGVVTIALLATVNGFLTDSPYDEVMDAAMAGASAINAMPVWAVQVTNICYAAAVVLIEPFYASAGFALYINSRTHLEGWDIEVAFRRMSARLASLRGGVAAVLVSLAALTCLTDKAEAADPRRAAAAAQELSEDMEAADEDPTVEEEAEAEPGGAKARVEEILKAPEFALDVRKQRITEDETSLDLGLGGGGAALRWVGYLIIVAAVVAVVVLLLKGRHAGKMRLPETAALSDGPRVVMGMEITKESLPDDVPGTALTLWGQGMRLDALRLLYRGALAMMVGEARLPVEESDTEGDCLRHAAGLENRAAADWFGRLTSAWIGAAYADVFPADDGMRHLCATWPFGKPVATGAGRRTTAALSLLNVAAAMFLSGCGQNARYEDVTVGYKGAARFQPWLAASRLLEASWHVEVRPTPGALPDEGTLLILPLGGVRSRGEAKDLLRWANRGGHLVILGAATDRFRNDWLNDAVTAPPAGEPLLAELGVTIREETSIPSSVTCEIDGRTLTVSAVDELVMDTKPLRWCDVVAGEPSRAVLASAPRGAGRVTILTSAQPWRNKWISEHDHAELLEAVVSLGSVDSVVFVNSGRVTFLQMLLDHAWMPLAALTVLILCWLWRHLPRFGPPLPADADRTRHFAAQLVDNGVFLWKRLPRRAELTVALRRSVLAAAEERGLHHGQGDFTAQLAARSGLPVERVSRALGEDGLDRPEDFTAVVADLQRLHESCGARA